MNISKVEICNFRCHKKTRVDLSDINILIGQNNTGKTAFLEAIDYAIGMGNRTPDEDDFYTEENVFDSRISDPIKVILEFRETEESRFPENALYEFDKAIQYDEEQLAQDPIRYIRLCYECKYDSETDKYVEERYFADINNERLIRDSRVRKRHLSFFPFFYLTTLRDIKREIRSKSSFFGKIKAAIDYKDKQDEINDLVGRINDILLEDNVTINSLVSRLKDLEDIRVASGSLYLQAFSKRSWELLDGLDIYLGTTHSNLALPISKHGMGTQSIAILLIFEAYLDILLPKIVENEKATPIIGIEEPEAHIHPQAQRAVFQQISSMKGQKLISTHSPFIADRACIHDYQVFNLENGIARVEKIPKYRKEFKFKYGLPDVAYKNNEYLRLDERLLVERCIQFRNAELLFSSLFILCEGDTEKVFLERIFPHCTGKTPGQLGISIISCEGQTYSPFLKMASKDAFNLKWFILSDAEEETKSKLENTIRNCGYDLAEVEDRIHYVPDHMNFEKYCVDFYKDEIEDVIIDNFGSEYRKFRGQPQNQSFSKKQLMERFLDSVKPRYAEPLALHIKRQELKVPDIIQCLIDGALEEVEKWKKY
jgi:putative ATP-dependent endonuclease of OLD family